MAFEQQTSNFDLISVRYSATLGVLFLANEKANEILDGLRSQFGDDQWRKGFTGNTNDGVTKEALRLAREKGLVTGRMTGALTGIRLIERQSEQGAKVPYLSVTVTDSDSSEKVNLSISLANQGAQMLVRKLYNAVPGANTVIGLFATYEKRSDAAQRAYANHGATLKQGDQEVKGVSPQDQLVSLVDNALEALRSAGVDDSETLNKRRQVITIKYHEELLNQIQDKWAAHYEGQNEPESQSSNGFEDDDIPF